MIPKPKRGRPPLPEEDRRDVTLTIRTTPERAKLLQEWAIAANIPFSELAADTLVRAAKRKRRPWE